MPAYNKFAPIEYVTEAFDYMGVKRPPVDKMPKRAYDANFIVDVSNLKSHMSAENYKRFLEEFFKKVAASSWDAYRPQYSQLVDAFKNDKFSYPKVTKRKRKVKKSSKFVVVSDDSNDGRAKSPARNNGQNGSSPRLASPMTVGSSPPPSPQRPSSPRSPSPGKSPTRRGIGRRLKMRRYLRSDRSKFQGKIPKDASVVWINPQNKKDFNRNLPGPVCKFIRRQCRYRDPVTKRYIRFPPDGSENDEYDMNFYFSNPGAKKKMSKKSKPKKTA